MKRTIVNIKETLQYTGITILSCLAALWFLVTGRRVK